MALIGGIFVFFSGLIYFLFMAAWLNLFLYLGQLRVMTLIAGLLAVFIATINIKDYFWFKRGVSLGISDEKKPALFDRIRQLLRLDSLPTVLDHLRPEAGSRSGLREPAHQILEHIGFGRRQPTRRIEFSGDESHDLVGRIVSCEQVAGCIQTQGNPMLVNDLQRDVQNRAVFRQTLFHLIQLGEHAGPQESRVGLLNR